MKDHDLQRVVVVVEADPLEDEDGRTVVDLQRRGARGPRAGDVVVVAGPRKLLNPAITSLRELGETALLPGMQTRLRHAFA